MMNRTIPILLLPLVLVGCRVGEGSISLVFPNQEALDATLQLEVLEIDRNMVGVGVVDVNCAALLTKFVEGTPPPGANLVDNPLEPPFQGRIVPAFPTGDPVIFIIGYNGSGDNKKPILAGCSEDYSTKSGDADIEIVMQIVIPDDTLLQKARGDFQVGMSGGVLPQELCVKVDAALPGVRDQRYRLPGITVEFSPDDAVGVGGLSAGQSSTVITDADGFACLPASLPPERGKYEVVAEAAELFARNSDKESLSRGVFGLSTISEVSFASQAQFSANTGAEIVDLTVAELNGDSLSDLVVLTCSGSEEGCRRGLEAEGALGTGGLIVFEDVLGARDELRRDDVGIVPSGLLAGEILPGGDDEIAVANSRRTDCGNRPAPCENSELRVYRVQAGQIQISERFALTASNAVGLTSFESEPGSGYLSLVTAGQGRVLDDQACNRAVCLEYNPRLDCRTDDVNEDLNGNGILDVGEDQDNDGLLDVSGSECGCPSGERCECPPGMNCVDGDELGVCVARDKELELIRNRGDRGRQLQPTGTMSITTDNVLSAATGAEQVLRPSTVEFSKSVLDLGRRPQGMRIEISGAQNPANNGTFAVRRATSSQLWFDNPGGVAESGSFSWRVLMAFDNLEACAMPELICGKRGTGRPDPNVCNCLDNLAQTCQAKDNCGCSIPDRVTVGDQGSGQTPHGIGAGILRSAADNGYEFIVATEGGLDFIARQTNENYAWDTQPIVNAPIHAIEVVDLDRDGAGDAVWFSRNQCSAGPNTNARCPIVEDAALAEGQAETAVETGCFGVFIRYIDPDKRLPDVPLDEAASCRRYPLFDDPADMCVGDFNGDGDPDVALSFVTKNSLTIYGGDGRGGVLYPPLEVTLPIYGGPITCADIDGDGRDDIIVASKETRDIAVLTTSR